MKQSLEEIDCSFIEDKVIYSPEISENFACPETEEAALEEWRIPETKKELKNLLSVSKKELACPEEYRPTPITVKQVTTGRPQTGSAQRIFSEMSSYMCLVVILFGLL